MRRLTVLGSQGFLFGLRVVMADFDVGPFVVTEDLIHGVTTEAVQLQAMVSTASASGFILNGSGHTDITASRQMMWPLIRSADSSIAFIFAAFHDDTCA